MYKLFFYLCNFFLFMSLFYWILSFRSQYSTSPSLLLSLFYSYVHLESKCPILPHLRNLKGGFPLYLPCPLFILLMKLDSSLSEWSTRFLHSLLLGLSFHVALNANSFLDAFSGSVIISYAVSILHNSSLVRSFRSLLSSISDTFGFNRCWQGVLDTLVAQHRGFSTSSKTLCNRKIRAQRGY